MTGIDIEAIEIDWTQGVGENFQRVKSAALIALEAANRRADEAAAKVFCPGTWRCPKCEFVLLQRNLNALDGSVTARDEAGDKCPNCNNTLWRVSWEQEAREAYGVVERYFDEKQAAVAELTALRAQVAELDAALELRRGEYRYVGLDGKTTTAAALEDERDTLRARVAELEAGGCARDQGTTQYCAEAVALQKRVAELERIAAFFASCIKSGESWSETCESKLAVAALKKEPRK